MQDHYKRKQRGQQEVQPRDHKRNDHDIKESEEGQTNAEADLRQDRLIILLDKHGRQIHDQDKTIE